MHFAATRLFCITTRCVCTTTTTTSTSNRFNIQAPPPRKLTLTDSSSKARRCNSKSSSENFCKVFRTRETTAKTLPESKRNQGIDSKTKTKKNAKSGDMLAPTTKSQLSGQDFVFSQNINNNNNSDQVKLECPEICGPGQLKTTTTTTTTKDSNNKRGAGSCKEVTDNGARAMIQPTTMGQEVFQQYTILYYVQYANNMCRIEH